MLLESFLHAESCFVTLTYAKEPPGRTLVPRDPVLWLKRLRKAINPIKVRYFLCGEYGDQNGRPHYHAALFGLGHQAEPDILKSWGLGLVHVGDLTVQSAQYIAGYVTKKMTTQDDPRLEGRHPEFARMSKSPGIGAKAMEAVARSLNDREGMKLIAREGDAPSVLKHGRKTLPLGRYLKERLRDELGFSEKGLPDEKLAQWVSEMSAMQKTVGRHVWKMPGYHVEDQAILNMETKANIYAKKGQL